MPRRKCEEFFLLQVQPVDIGNLPGWVIGAHAVPVAALFALYRATVATSLQEARERAIAAEQRVIAIEAELRALQKSWYEDALHQQRALQDSIIALQEIRRP